MPGCHAAVLMWIDACAVPILWVTIQAALASYAYKLATLHDDIKPPEQELITTACSHTTVTLTEPTEFSAISCTPAVYATESPLRSVLAYTVTVVPLPTRRSWTSSIFRPASLKNTGKNSPDGREIPGPLTVLLVKSEAPPAI